MQITITFETLAELNKWMFSWKRRLLEKIGLFRWDIFSPVMCSCELYPNKTSLKSIEELYSTTDLPKLFKSLTDNYLDWIYINGELYGKVLGIEVTQEDTYWIIANEKTVTKVTTCAEAEFEKDNGEDKDGKSDAINRTIREYLTKRCFCNIL